MRIAIVHDQLYVFGGAERVLAEIIACFPEADVFALFDRLPDSERGFLNGRKVTTTPLNRFPRVERWHRHYFLLMPLMIEQLDLSAYDVVVSSSYLVAKGVIVGPDQLHISYVHSPMRYAWDLQQRYLDEMKLRRGWRSIVVRLGLHYLRLWDRRSGSSVDAFATNSRFVARRVKKFYGRQSTVIHPPVDCARFWCRFNEQERDGFFLTVSRLVPYKRVDLVVKAFSARPELSLVVIGDGPEISRIQRLAGTNVRVLGQQPDHVVVDHMQRATAFIYAAEEDFGISPVEAMACGTPVIGYGKGGLIETVPDLQTLGPAGVLYPEQTVESLNAAIDTFIAHRSRITADNARYSAARFGQNRFRREFTAFVRAEVLRFREEFASPNAAGPTVAEAEIEDFRDVGFGEVDDWAHVPMGLKRRMHQVQSAGQSAAPDRIPAKCAPVLAE